MQSNASLRFENEKLLTTGKVLSILDPHFCGIRFRVSQREQFPKAYGINVEMEWIKITITWGKLVAPGLVLYLFV